MSWADSNRQWLATARERWAPSNPEPLILRAWMGSPLAYDSYDPITIEGALQSVVCMRETSRLPDDVYSDCPVSAPLSDTDIQVPIVDTIIGGTPVAHSSVGVFSLDAWAGKRQNWKRARAEHYDRAMVKTAEAGTKTQMVLKATATAAHVDFYVEGDRAKLSDLLSDVTQLGAGRSGGLGSVHGWEVLSSPVRWWWFGPGERLMRALPLGHVESIMSTQYDAREATLRAPYWHPRTRTLCGVPTQRLGESLGQVAGGFFVTSHAVSRYRERAPGAARLSYDQALGELVNTMQRSHFVKAINDGLDLWRGPKPHRLRLRVAPGSGSVLPQVVTVLRGCDRRAAHV